jgi:hypothetical protein
MVYFDPFEAKKLQITKHFAVINGIAFICTSSQFCTLALKNKWD